MPIRPYKTSLTFEDKCSKGGEDFISRILCIGTFRANYDKLRTRLFQDSRLRLLTFDFVLRHKLLMILLVWNIKKNLGLKVNYEKLLNFHEMAKFGRVAWCGSHPWLGKF